VIDVSTGSFAVAVDGFEAVSGGVFEEGRVIVVGVNPTRARGTVIGKARVDAGLPEAIDMTWARRDERDVNSPCDRMILVRFREREVAPDREARRPRRLCDLELIEHCREKSGAGDEVTDSKGDVVVHGPTDPGTRSHSG
jgi:hypothetical protein